MKLGFPDEKTVIMGAFGPVYYALPEPGLIAFVWDMEVTPRSPIQSIVKYNVLVTEYDSDLHKTVDEALLPTVFHLLSRGFRRIDLRAVAEDELTAQAMIHDLLGRYQAGYNKYGRCPTPTRF